MIGALREAFFFAVRNTRRGHLGNFVDKEISQFRKLLRFHIGRCEVPAVAETVQINPFQDRFKQGRGSEDLFAIVRGNEKPDASSTRNQAAIYMQPVKHRLRPVVIRIDPWRHERNPSNLKRMFA